MAVYEFVKWFDEIIRLADESGLSVDEFLLREFEKKVTPDSVVINKTEVDNE